MNFFYTLRSVKQQFKSFASPHYPIYFLLVFLILPFCTQAQSNGFVKTRGQEIIAPGGKKLLLKGIGLGNWLVPEGYMFKLKGTNSPRLINELVNELIGPEKTENFWRSFRNNYITVDDIQFIKNAGFNSIRIPFHYKLFSSDSFKDTFLGRLDTVIQWCKKEDLYVILDLHCAPGGQTGDNIDDSWGYPYLFESPKMQAEAVSIWKRIADHYKNEKIIIGYDLLNEPIATYFDASKLNPLLEPFYKKLVEAIRTVDKNHIVIIGGAQWDTNFKVFGQPFDSNAIYTFHKYWCDTTQSEIQEYVNFRKKYNVPVWMGESGENTNQWITAFRKLLEKNNIGWSFWTYKRMDTKRCVVTFTPPVDYDSILTFAKSPRITFKQIRENRPSENISEKILNGLLENCKFNNCKINREYLRALGLNNNIDIN